MRLQHFSPPIPNELVQALQEIGIRTDTDLLLSEDPTKIFTRLPRDLGISLLDFRRAVAKVAELASAAPTYGDKLLEQELKRQEDIFGDDMRVGVPALDALLGGFSPPRVIEVSGDKGSGKTVRKYTFLFHQRLNFRNIGTRIAACTTASGPSQQLERPLDR